jgi:hypothetical protein
LPDARRGRAASAERRVSEAGGAVAAPLWRVFPHDPAAAVGEPFSAAMVPRGQGSGRFDVPDLSPVWYLAESAAHAAGETLQGLRGQTLADPDLVRGGCRLAVVSVDVAPLASAGIVDLCDPDELAGWRIRPDHLASRDLTVTQRIARRLAADGAPGFQWWSSIHGDWHATILFQANLPDAALTFASPTALTVDHPAVIAASRTLGIRIERAKRAR